MVVIGVVFRVFGVVDSFDFVVGVSLSDIKGEVFGRIVCLDGGL